MADETVGQAEVKDTDIVFDCPNCSKSLAIDYRGAGLFIVCPDCGNRVQVPIPEGMEISDIDSSAEEQAIRIVHLRESLAEAQRRIEELDAEVADLRQRRDKLEKFRTQTARLFEELNRELPPAERTLARLSEILKKSADAFRE